MPSPRIYVFAAVLLLALSVLVLTRNVPSQTAQSGDISVLNKTTAFQVISAQQVNNRLSLSLKNNSVHTVTAFVITIGSDFRITDDFITSEVPHKIGIKSQKIFEKTYPIPAALRTAAVVLQAVVFEDKTGEGDPIIFEDIRDHLALRLDRRPDTFARSPSDHPIAWPSLVDASERHRLQIWHRLSIFCFCGSFYMCRPRIRVFRPPS